MATMVWENAAVLCHIYIACPLGNVLVRTAAVRSVDIVSQCFKATRVAQKVMPHIFFLIPQ